MAGRNGAATPTRRIYSAIPKTRIIPIRVERGGKAVVVDFIGYHKDHPEVWNEVQAQAAWDAWTAACYVDNIDPESGEILMPPKVFRKNDVAEATLRRDLLIATLKEQESGAALSETDADVLAAEDGGWQHILHELGWWSAAPQSEAPADPEGEGGAADTSGDASSPEPAPAMALTTG